MYVPIYEYARNMFCVRYCTSLGNTPSCRPRPISGNTAFPTNFFYYSWNKYIIFCISSVVCPFAVSIVRLVAVGVA